MNLQGLQETGELVKLVFIGFESRRIQGLRGAKKKIRNKVRCILQQDEGWVEEMMMKIWVLQCDSIKMRLH